MEGLLSMGPTPSIFFFYGGSQYESLEIADVWYTFTCLLLQIRKCVIFPQIRLSVSCKFLGGRGNSIVWLEKTFRYRSNFWNI